MISYGEMMRNKKLDSFFEELVEENDKESEASAGEPEQGAEKD